MKDDKKTRTLSEDELKKVTGGNIDHEAVYECTKKCAKEHKHGRYENDMCTCFVWNDLGGYSIP